MALTMLGLAAAAMALSLCASGCGRSSPTSGETSSTSSTASASAPAHSASAARVAPPAPAAGTSWPLASRPAVGSFVGGEDEDFVGVLARSDGTTSLFAADGADGRTVWSKTVDAGASLERTVSFALLGKLVAWARAGEGVVHVLDAATGDERRVLSLRDGQTVSRMCGSHGSTITIPQPDGYNALLDLESGAQPNNSGISPRRPCMPRGPDHDVPQWVRERLPRDLEIGAEPAYEYEPGRVVAKSRKGRPDPILLGLGPAGNTRWQAPLVSDGAAPLSVVDARAVGDEFVVLTNGEGDEGRLFGVDVDRGTLRWTHRTPCRARWLAASASRIYVGSEPGRLHVLRADGAVLGAYGVGGAACTLEGSAQPDATPR